MKKLIHIVLIVSFAFSVLPARAQNKTMSQYWDDVDFSDSTLAVLQELPGKLVSFFYSFTDGDEQRFDSLSIEGLGIVLDKAKANMRVYEFILDFALNGYSAMGRDAVTNYLLSYPKLTEGEISMKEGMRLDSITEPYQKVKVGAKAPEFSGITIDGKEYSLYGSTAKKVIVVFWSTDCEYCHDFLVHIRKNLDLKSDFELVTFALADNQDEVVQTVKKMRLPGYHFYDALRWESKAFLDYHVTSTPLVLLLDADRTIVCKPYDWDELKEWLKKNK
jgi:thioredoxin-related protein